MEVRGRRSLAGTAFCVVGRGSNIRGACGLRLVERIAAIASPSTTVFELPGIFNS